MPIITVDAALAIPRALRRSIIGIDVGSAKTGFAVAATAQHPAQPAGVLRALIDRRGPLPQFAAHTSTLIKQHAPAFLVVGWPLQPSGLESKECALVRGFVDALEAANVYTPVVLWDERGSSAAARRELKGGRTRTPPEFQSRVDEEAARLILESFLAHARAVAAPQPLHGVLKPPIASPLR